MAVQRFEVVKPVPQRTEAEWRSIVKRLLIEAGRLENLSELIGIEIQRGDGATSRFRQLTQDRAICRTRLMRLAAEVGVELG